MNSSGKRNKEPIMATKNVAKTCSPTTRAEKNNISGDGCFFCIMKEPDLSIRREGIKDYLKILPLIEGDELVLVLSELWSMAMLNPTDKEHPSLGVFDCMASLINKGINRRSGWLLKNQNIYAPYYAAHIIGSFTMNNIESATLAVESGVITPLLELLRGKMSWVEQRVAVRALGHIASYDKTFNAVAKYEEEVVKLAMHLAYNGPKIVYKEFVGVKDTKNRLKYHSDLLTRGIDTGLETEKGKAEEWANQLHCWSIHLLNCFAIKERSLDQICKPKFLNVLIEMRGGLLNQTSSVPAGVGLIRVLCYSKYGRASIANSESIVKKLCDLSRSSDDFQYMGIDCLLRLLTDSDTRFKVIHIAAPCMIDLIELRSLGGRSNVGEVIARTLHGASKRRDWKMLKNQEVERALAEIWKLKVERRREQQLSTEEAEERRVISRLIKLQANRSYSLGNIKAATLKYTEALELCPLKSKRERLVLYSNRAQCRLILGDAEAAISDSTRALCLSSPPNSHAKSLWRRSRAYEMKGLAKESLMDCISFVNRRLRSSKEDTKHAKIPYHAVRLITKQMESTRLFKGIESQEMNQCYSENVSEDLIERKESQ